MFNFSKKKQESKDVSAELIGVVVKELTRIHALVKLARQPRKGMVLTEIENLLEKISKI
jgi:hypothetical protein